MLGYVILLISVVFCYSQRSNFLAAYAHLCYSKGQVDKGLKLYDTADRIGKMKFNSRISYGYINLRAGNLDKADKIFNLIMMSPLKKEEKIKLKASHALVFWKRGDVTTAIEMLEEVIEKMPSTTHYGSLGYMYVFAGEYQKALEFNLKAYEYNPTDIIILENVALTYFKLGEMDNARRYYGELMAQNPHYPDCFYEYGQFLIKSGDVEKGIENYKKALECNFSFLCMVKRTDIIRELEQLENVSLPADDDGAETELSASEL